ncbi:CDP-alcohol phosphatidyltransferase family protein [Aquipuribacter nitratireducens]|uniref:CDP-alcohol phosphatidyltransferase family protein n=1 Tax=Aquipuribacter nitratireducens TaxID=650104 RepID=A0ABW0GT80_9MICO
MGSNPAVPTRSTTTTGPDGPGSPVGRHGSGEREAITTTVVSDRVLTVPNAISLARLACVPLFAAFIVRDQDLLALLVLLLAGVSDYVDGVLARRWGQVTRLGQLLDPAADRLYVTAALLGLGWREVLPWWLVLTVVVREVVLTTNVLVLRRHGFTSLPVHLTGKLATFVLLLALPLLLLAGTAETLGPWVADALRPVAWALVLWGAGLYWWAALLYLHQTHLLIHGRLGPDGSRPAAVGPKAGTAGAARG